MLDKLNTREQMQDAANLMDMAQRYWEALAGFRESRRVVRDMVMGRQWNKIVEYVDSCGRAVKCTEAEYIREHGGFPLQQNIMQMQLNNLLGQYRSNPTTTMVLLRSKTDGDTEEMLNNAIMSALDINQARDIDAAMLREFLVSGCSAQKIEWDYVAERDCFDARISNVNPASLFFNADTQDPRGSDITFVGQVKDMDINALLCNKDICKNKEDSILIHQWYGALKEKNKRFYNGTALDTDNVDNMNFLLPADMSLCRVIEVWYRENRDGVFVYDNLTGRRGFTDKTIDEIVELNTARMLVGQRNNLPEDKIPLMQYERRVEQKWLYKWLTPCGHVLQSGESPYKHQSHPYVLKLHPLIDGEVHGYMKNSIDQQEAINRSMLQVDKTMRMLSKIVVPASALEGMSRSRFEEEMQMPDKVLVVKDPKVGGADTMPHQLFAGINASVMQYFLGMQTNLIDQVSGIHGAIQGKTPSTGTSGKLYQQETANASLNTMDIIQSFSSFLELRNRKLLQIIMQFYEDRRPIMSFKRNKPAFTYYDTSLVRDADVEVKVIQSTDTPVYRALQDDMVMGLVDRGIPLPLALKHMSAAFAQEMAQALEQEQQKQMEAQQQMAQQQMAQQQGEAPPQEQE